MELAPDWHRSYFIILSIASAAAPSEPSPNKWAYTFSVITGELCPNRRLTETTSMPALISAEGMAVA